MSITISAIIPTHKRISLLERSIKSVLEQTEPVDEIIIVDDAGCTDTKNLVDSYHLNYMRYVSNKNPGASSSRNLGASLAKSEYIAFLDDDDEWIKDKIGYQKKLVIEKKLHACFSQILIKYEGTSISYSTKTAGSENPKVDICIENFIGGTISSVIKKDLFVEVGGFDVNLPAREEYDLWIRLIHRNAKIGVVEMPLSIAYRSLHNRNRISADINNYEYSMKVLNLKHSELVNENLTSAQKSLRARRQYEFLAAQAVSIGLRRKSSVYYFKSLKCKFSMKVMALSLVALISPVSLIRIRSLL